MESRDRLNAADILSMPLSGGILMAVLAVTVYFLDRFSKNAVSSGMTEGESFSILPGVFHLTLVHNTGGAFGILKGNTDIFKFSAILFTFVAVLYTSLRWRFLAIRDKVSICLILGGTLGNLFDRVRLGYVVDFIDLRIWPVFNIADCCITVGAAALIFSALFPRQREN